MALESLHLKKEFEIRQLTSLHYFEYKSDFIFKSEYHDDWKLLYAEDGSAEISFPTKNRHLSLCKRVNFSSSLQTNTTLLGPPPAILPFYLPQVFTVIPQIFHCSPTKSLYARKKRLSYYRHSPQKEKATFLQKSTQHRLLPSNEDITSLSAVNNLSAFTLKCSSSA